MVKERKMMIRKGKEVNDMEKEVDKGMVMKIEGNGSRGGGGKDRNESREESGAGVKI